MNIVVEQKQSESPALKRLAADYPLRFDRRVPKIVKIIENVMADWPMPIGCMVARAGELFPVWVNSHGAVAAIFPNGKMLGLKPDEFEVTGWHQ